MYLLDTSVVSEATKPRPSAAVRDWFDATPSALLFTSVVVIGEIRKGIVQTPGTRLREWLATAIVMFEGRLLPVTLDIAERWGEMNGEALRRGTPLPAIDSLIAATAIVHDLTVLTRNVRDFERCGAKVLSPWERG